MYIPEKIVYIHNGNKQKVGFRWEEDKEDSHVETVQSAYCCDVKNKNMTKTGENWASRIRTYNEETKTYSTGKVEYNYIDNLPIKGFKIVSLESRSEGGRAYKVVTQDGFYFDLREDSLLDIILNSSIIKGIIQCDMIWASTYRGFKLIRVDSTLYLNILKEVKDKQEIRYISIKSKNIKVGQVYVNETGSIYIYLGKHKNKYCWIKPYDNITDIFVKKYGDCYTYLRSNYLISTKTIPKFTSESNFIDIDLDRIKNRINQEWNSLSLSERSTLLQSEVLNDNPVTIERKSSYSTGKLNYDYPGLIEYNSLN